VSLGSIQSLTELNTRYIAWDLMAAGT
jgi:hypothetical protein